MAGAGVAPPPAAGSLPEDPQLSFRLLKSSEMGIANRVETGEVTALETWPVTASALQSHQRAPLDLRAVWQVSSMSLGVGVFAIPYAFLKLGWAQASVWVVLMGLFSNVALQGLLQCAADHGVASYEGLAELAFGRAGKWAMVLITFVTTFTATLSYASAATDLLLGVVTAFIVDVDIYDGDGVSVLSSGKKEVLLALLLASVLPRCLSPSMGGNAWISTAGVFTVSSVAAVFVAWCGFLLLHGCGSSDECGARPPVVDTDAGNALQYAAILAFSYSMVFAVFPVLEERVVDGAVRQAVPAVQRAASLSVALSSCIYLLVGFAGSFAFGTVVKPVALYNLPLTEPLAQVVTLATGLTTLLLVAIVSFPTIQSLEVIVQMLGGPRGPAVRPSLVVMLGAGCLLIDAVLPTKVAFALTGSLGLAFGAYMMPCLLTLWLSGPRGTCWRRRCTARVPALLVLLFGALLLFGSTPVILARLLASGAPPASRSLVAAVCHRAAA